MSLWLSRIAPNLSRREVLRDLADVHRLHTRVMSLFGSDLGDNPRSRLGVLFRVETVHNRVGILLQSRQLPVEDYLPDGYGTIETTELTPLLTKLAMGSAVRYRILANPAKQLPRGHAGPGRPGQRVRLFGQAAEDWWRDRALKAGLELQSVQMSPSEDLVGRKGRMSIRHAAARYDGTAVVRDTEAVQDALQNGVGRAKSYGCGLLSLAI